MPRGLQVPMICYVVMTRFLCKLFVFFFQAEDGIRDYKVTGVQTCALRSHRGISKPALSSVAGALRGGVGAALEISGGEIGRASCRERVQIAERAVRRKQKEKRDDGNAGLIAANLTTCQLRYEHESLKQY